MKMIRTDLAVEICNDILGHNQPSDGIQCNKTLCDGMVLEEVNILNSQGEALSGKPIGHYLTLNTGKLWLDARDTFRDKLFSFAALLRNFLMQRIHASASILVAGLGNRSITADAIGPDAVKNLIVTRHIKKEKPLLFEDLGVSDVCAVAPGVLGQTGIESADVVKSIVHQIQPSAVIVIDALASRDLERLVTTIQICDSGIRPGSGIGNCRPELTQSELGIPVISIGVPTVVDAATLASDAILRFSGKAQDAERIRSEWSGSNLNFFVTPKETDQITQTMASFIGYGINLALNPDLSFEDMLSLVG